MTIFSVDLSDEGVGLRLFDAAATLDVIEDLYVRHTRMVP